MNSISILDILILFLLLFSGIYVSTIGFFQELGSKASYFIGILSGLMFTKRLSILITEHTDISYGIFSAYLSFLFLFVIGSIFCRIVARIMESALNVVKLSNISRILGFFLGVLECFIVLSFILWILKYQTIFNINDFLNNSFIYNNITSPFALWISNSGIIKKVAEVKNNVILP